LSIIRTKNLNVFIDRLKSAKARCAKIWFGYALIFSIVQPIRSYVKPEITDYSETSNSPPTESDRRHSGYN
jgi:hypothetical protein